MQIPREARRKARELYASVLDASGRPDAGKALAAADALAASAPRHVLQILKEYTRLIRLETAKHHAVIESAAPVEKSVHDEIVSSLAARDGGKVTVETRVDPSLIGGTRIRLGSEVWDASVSSRLAALS